jgi:Tfp pilus assembly protein PilX
MTSALQPASPSPIKSGTNSCIPHRQRGVVLVIALILLVVISLLAVTSMRNAGSSESMAGNVRTTELATQAAEIALRHCEASVLKAMGGTAAYDTTFVAANILPATNPPRWQDRTITTGWDSSSAAVFLIPLKLLNQTGMAITTYQRPPECMVESLPVILPGSAAVNTTASFVVTARGFGPEVAEVPAGANRVRPAGSEVWLQSHIQLE